MSILREIKIYNTDSGFDSKGLTTEGLIYGKFYLFEVFGLSEDEEEPIRWNYVGNPIPENTKTDFKTHSEADTLQPKSIAKLEADIFKRKEINSVGKVIQFTINDIGLCGSYIELTAYLDQTTERANSINLSRSANLGRTEDDNRSEIIDDSLNEVSIKIWVHYRFRWFNRKQLLNEVLERKNHPWKISQRSTSLCGMACIFYFLIQIDPVAYELLALHLHQFGYAVHNSYFLKPNPLMLDVNPLKDSEFPKGMAYSDWMTLASMRNMESRIGYTGKNSQVFSSINWPPIMIKLSRKFLGFKTVEFKIYSLVKSYVRDYFLKNQKLEVLRDQINGSYLEGFKILLLIDVGMLENKNIYSLKDYIHYHWVVYEGNLEFIDNDGNIEHDLDRVSQVKFNTFSWGENPIHSRTSIGVSKQAFIKNYYGFIRMK